MPVTAARKELVANQIKFAESSDAAVATRNPRAVVDERISLFDTEASASAVASDIISLFGPKRGTFRIEYIGEQYQRSVGETITITNAAMGLTSAEGLIISVAEDSTKLSTVVEVLV